MKKKIISMLLAGAMIGTLVLTGCSSGKEPAKEGGTKVAKEDGKYVIGFANASVSNSSVSYTHLDVYKRQALGYRRKLC